MKTPYNKLTSLDKEIIIKTYYNFKKLSFLDISNKLNISNRAISRVLQEAGINTKRLNRYIITNPNYFSKIDSEFKAYILGFIYADGFVGDNNDFAIALSDKHDENLTLLNNLKNEIGLTIDIKHSNTSSRLKDGTKKIHGQYSLRFVCKDIVSDLNKLGVFPRKSLVMTDLPNIEEKYLNHFIRGYFDGDGSIYSYIDKYDNRLRNGFEILGTEQFLYKIQDILVCNCNIKRTKLHKTHSRDITRISYKGNSSITKIREFLYNDATYYIKYKHDRFYNIQ